MLYIAADHAGFALKEALKKYLVEQKIKHVDLGATALNESDDYPIYAQTLAKKVAQEKNARGILICGSGQGVCIVANRTSGVRAALAWSPESARLSRNDDNANILCLPGRLIKPGVTKQIVDTWLTTKFSGLARHKRRIAQIDKK